VSQLELWPDEVPGERLSWSVSRDRRLRDCARKYYLYHYGSRGGQEAERNAQSYQALVLRGLRTRHMWVGEVVHEMIELALGAVRRGETVPVEALVERGTRRMRAQYAESVQGVYWDRPQTACGLIEHEYKESIAREEWRAQRDRMERCLRGFYALPLFETIKKTPLWRWLAVETMGTFDLDGASIVVRPDFAWRGADGRVSIVDWKTGKARGAEERAQLLVYGLFARKNWGVREEGFNAVVAHLDGENGPSVDEYHLSAAELSEAEQTVIDSVRVMRSLLPDGEADLTRFPMTEQRERCGYCSFRRLCGR
jgi:hypothetical protein